MNRGGVRDGGGEQTVELNHSIVTSLLEIFSKEWNAFFLLMFFWFSLSISLCLLCDGIPGVLQH